MPQIRRRFPNSFKREAIDHVLCEMSHRHVPQALGIAESLLDKWKSHYEQQGGDAFLGNGKHRVERAELLRLHQQLAQATMVREVLKNHLPGSPWPIGLVARPLR
ncbi:MULTISPECIES: transposase [Pseudomonas]|uniref:transposase n=1 Tax=Pseudomonas TaxID=286 RepID=UPI0015BDD201|nr:MULTISPECIES: transposase [Pseudomonas]